MLGAQFSHAAIVCVKNYKCYGRHWSIATPLLAAHAHGCCEKGNYGPGGPNPTGLTASFRNFCARPFLIVIVVDCHYMFWLPLDFGCLIFAIYRQKAPFACCIPPSAPLAASLLRHFCCAVCSAVCLLAASHCRACQHNCCTCRLLAFWPLLLLQLVSPYWPFLLLAKNHSQQSDRERE